MATTKAYTDLEQSKVLAKILPIESADMRYVPFGDTHPWIWSEQVKLLENGAIPCWSLAALLGVLPEGVVEHYYVPNIQKENGKYTIAYGDENLLCVADNPIDACYEIVIKLKELNLL